MAASLDYQVVDVFTDAAFAGNPLAVVSGADGLSTGQLQALASEFNLSETAFPLPASSPDADYRLRIFTPAVELPFAGHPSIGSAWVQRELGRVGDGRVVQECGAGLMPLLIDGDRVTLTGGTPSVGDPVDAAPVLAAVGLDAADLADDGPVRFASTGLAWGFLPVRPGALARCRPDAARLAAQGEAGVAVVAYADGVAHARVFAGGAGVFEDPATGSAALAFGAWLAAAGLVAADGETEYVVQQGLEMGRPSRLDCVVQCAGGRAVECRVTGSVVAVAEGRIRVPS
ncbi:MAG TPA: PhzF family phenazine biosynthesis protein [Mycobacteriales bacterium]|nr:PhzF family phenazine biosynthesis protein [Mycobacteriales bacterium]